MQKRIFVNNLIKAKEVRLIDEKGGQLGVVPFAEAMRIAAERQLDLIQLTEKVEPPVCRLGDYGKHLYRQQKKDRESRKHTETELKEIRLTFNISPHDMETRAKQAQKFLSKGDRVRIVLRLHGRQKALEKVAKEKFEALLEMLKAVSPIKIEKEMRQEPRGITMIVAKA